MPRRNPILGGLLAGMAGPLQDYLATLQKDKDTEKANQRIAKRQADESARTEERTLRKDYSDRVIRGEMDPEQAQRAMTLAGHPVSQGFFDSVQPSLDTETANVVKGISGTKSYSDLPSEAGLNASMPRRLAPLVESNIPLKFQDTSTDTPPMDQPDPHAQRISQALYAKRRALAGAGPISESTSVDPTSGAPQRIAQQYNPLTESMKTLSTQATGPGAEQSGVLDALKKLAGEKTDLTGGGPEIRGEGKNRETNVTEPLTLLNLDKELNVRDAHQRRNATFAHSLTAGNEALTTVTIHDAAGNEIPAVLNKKTGEITPGQIPEGMKGGKPARLTQQQQTTQTDLNTAEVEGVKLLEQLHATGLDKSNDPGDPRWTKFLVNNLKVAPADAAKGSAQWSAAYINATLSRTLMGGRPSQYIAELMQPHLPQQGMSGMQLANVTRKVLGTVDGKRQELAGVSKVPLDQLTPKSGKSFNQYRTESEGIPAPSGVKPMFTIDANGNLVPVK